MESQCFTVSHSRSPGAALSFHNFLKEIQREGDRSDRHPVCSVCRHLPKTSPLLNLQFQSYAPNGTISHSQLFFPTCAQMAFGAAVPGAARLSVIPAIGLHSQTHFLLLFNIKKKKSANLQARVVVKFTCTVS